MRINLIKMVLLPKILYILWYFPIYLPLKFFKILDSMLRAFVWGNSRHKLPWRVLRNPSTLGGAVLPDFNPYYIAAHLDKLTYQIHSFTPPWVTNLYLN